MTRLNHSLTRWAVSFAAALLLVGATSLSQLGFGEAVSPLAGAVLLAVAASWYWSREARIEPEALPKLRFAGLAVVVLLLALLYGLLVAAISLPAGLESALFGLLLAAAAAAITVALVAAIDLSLIARQRWARILAGALAVGLAITLAVAALRAQGIVADPAGGFIDPIRTPIPLLIGIGILAFIAPLEWVVALDGRQRVIVLLGWVLSSVPFAIGVYAERLYDLPQHQLLLDAVRTSSMLLLCYLAVVLARATLALPGARAYERKVRELDAIYAFGLTSRTVFNPEELQAAVLDAMLRVVEPDVAVVVEPDDRGPGCLCVLQRADSEGKHIYRFRSRAPWQALADRFEDRLPVVVVDHRKAPPGVLERIWEPASGSSVIAPVIAEGMPRAVLIAGRFETHAFHSAEVRSVANFASQVALGLEHAELMRDVVESERRKRELEIARDLQMNLLPKSPPSLRRLDIADRSEPATEVGGDYFDYLPLSEDRLGVVVGDVAGHGMPAGLLMAMAKSAIHTQIQSDSSPALLIERLGETLLKMSAENQFMTLVFAEIEADASSFRYANAGHHYPLHYRAATETFHDLESTTIPLGLMERPPGPLREHPLGPGDLLIFYSDGLVEASDGTEEQFEITRLRDVVLACRDQPAKTIVEESFAAARRFCGDAPFHDDATLVVVKVLSD